MRLRVECMRVQCTFAKVARHVPHDTVIYEAKHKRVCLRVCKYVYVCMRVNLFACLCVCKHACILHIHMFVCTCVC